MNGRVALVGWGWGGAAVWVSLHCSVTLNKDLAHRVSRRSRRLSERIKEQSWRPPRREICAESYTLSVAIGPSSWRPPVVLLLAPAAFDYPAATSVGTLQPICTLRSLQRSRWAARRNCRRWRLQARPSALACRRQWERCHGIRSVWTPKRGAGDW